MNHLHFDSLGGASGDMILAALIDLGAPRDELQRQLAALPIGPFEIQAAARQDGGLRGLQVQVVCPPGQHHAHRGLREIRALIGASALPPRARDNALRVFQRLAEAEARVHGTTPDQVHFHEVGAVDAIVDIAGACLALELLAVTTVSVGPLPLGHGTVACAHGLLPVPAPATVELLQGLRVAAVDEPFELVTPTGAALLSTWAGPAAQTAGGILRRAGHGFGHHRLQARPNLLRALLLEPAPRAAGDECLVLECNLDDISPELLGDLPAALLAAGALDAFLTPVQMKKQRPGFLLTILCAPERKDPLLDLVFRESTTFGIREHPVRRTVLERRQEEQATPFGQVRVKVGSWQGRVITRAPEHDDCLRLARQAGVPVRAVYEAALAASHQSAASIRPSKT